MLGRGAVAVEPSSPPVGRAWSLLLLQTSRFHLCLRLLHWRMNDYRAFLYWNPRQGTTSWGWSRHVGPSVTSAKRPLQTLSCCGSVCTERDDKLRREGG